MNKKKNDDVISILNNIKVVLYLILVVLIVNVILVSVCVSKNVSNNAGGDQGIIENEIPEYDVSKFNQVNYDEFNKLISSKGTHVIYIGRETCSYCAMFIPIMNEAQEKYDFKTNYFDISSIFDFSTNSILDQKAYNEMSNLNEFVKENFLATPMVLVFKDGKYVDGTLGYQDINTYSQFLEKNDFKAK